MDQIWHEGHGWTNPGLKYVLDSASKDLNFRYPPISYLQIPDI